MNMQFRISTRWAQTAARAVRLRQQLKLRLWSAQCEEVILQVQYRAMKPYHLEYLPEWHDVTKPANVALLCLESRDACAELVGLILARKGGSSVFAKAEEAGAALFFDHPSKVDLFSRNGIGGGCLDVVLTDGRSARFLFGSAERVPEPAFGPRPAVPPFPPNSPADFERNLAWSRLMPAMPARWMHTKPVPWWWWLIGPAAAVGGILVLR